MFGVSDRIIMNPEDIQKREDLFDNINYDKIFEIIEDKRKASMKWINNLIFTENDKKISSYDILDARYNNLEM